MGNVETKNVDRMEKLWYTGGTVSAKKLSLKSLALSGLFGAKWSLPKKSFSICGSIKKNEEIQNLDKMKKK